VIEQEMTMIKTISAALLAVSMLAAPAMAAGPSHVAPHAAAINGHHVSANVQKAQARMHKHRTVRHHRHLRGHHVRKPVVMHRGHRH